MALRKKGAFFRLLAVVFLGVAQLLGGSARPLLRRAYSVIPERTAQFGRAIVQNALLAETQGFLSDLGKSLLCVFFARFDLSRQNVLGQHAQNLLLNCGIDHAFFQAWSAKEFLQLRVPESI